MKRQFNAKAQRCKDTEGENGKAGKRKGVFAPEERYIYRRAIRLRRYPETYQTDPGSMSLERVEGRTRYLERNVYSTEYGTKEGKKMPVLTAEDRKFWEENGYVVIHNAVPPENLKAAEQAVWDFLEMQPDDPASWYPEPPRATIMTEMYQHQALWDNRQYPRVHQAFAEVWGTEKLWASIDRASMNPPELPDWKYPGKLHWDTQLEPPIEFWVQGVLYLTDTAANQGAFTCVPGFHRQLEAWLKDLPPDANPREQDLESLGARPIPGKAGDLIIWHSALPHGSSSNTATHPRVAQYITMFPSQGYDEDARNQRVKAWQDRLAGLVIEITGITTWKLRNEKEHQTGQTAELSPLGRKLLGLDQW